MKPKNVGLRQCGEPAEGRADGDAERRVVVLLIGLVLVRLQTLKLASF